MASGWPLTQPNYPFSQGGKSCALAPLNIIPKFPNEKHQFLSYLSPKSSTFMFSICMITKGYKVFLWKLCQSKNGVCDESPPKRRTVAETFAWRLQQSSPEKISKNSEMFIQCKPDISRLVGSMERYRDISGSAIYRATAKSQNPGQVFQRVVNGDGAFVCLAANSARRQRISWHLSKFDVALQNRVVEFQTKAVCA